MLPNLEDISLSFLTQLSFIRAISTDIESSNNRGKYKCVIYEGWAGISYRIFAKALDLSGSGVCPWAIVAVACGKMC